MQVSTKVNFEELARSTDEMNGAQLKAVCVEAGMIALREGSKMIGHEHYLSGVLEVQSKKKNDQVSFESAGYENVITDVVGCSFTLLSFVLAFLHFAICVQQVVADLCLGWERCDFSFNDFVLLHCCFCNMAGALASLQTVKMMTDRLVDPVQSLISRMSDLTPVEATAPVTAPVVPEKPENSIAAAAESTVTETENVDQLELNDEEQDGPNGTIIEKTLCTSMLIH